MTQIRQRFAVIFALIMLALGAPFSTATELAAATQTLVEAQAQTQAKQVVNINTADADTLAKSLKGIGVAKAQAIVAYREAHGAFASADDLIQVKGIGAATVEANADIIVTE